jgi:hypothetical protein
MVPPIVLAVAAPVDESKAAARPGLLLTADVGVSVAKVNPLEPIKLSARTELILIFEIRMALLPP